MLTNWLYSNFFFLSRLAKFSLSVLPSFTWFFIRLVFYKLNFVSLQDYSLTFLIFSFVFMFFPYFSLFLSFFFFFSHSTSAQLAACKKKRRVILFYFLMANNYFVLNEFFCFYLTIFIFFISTIELHSF